MPMMGYFFSKIKGEGLVKGGGPLILLNNPPPLGTATKPPIPSPYRPYLFNRRRRGKRLGYTIRARQIKDFLVPQRIRTSDTLQMLDYLL